LNAGRTLVVAAAGTSTRFGATVGFEVLKSIYQHEPTAPTILGTLLDRAGPLCDRIVVVGGYRMADLEAFLARRSGSSLQLVYNPRFHDWGSHYSMQLGLQAALAEADCREVLFAEGDLVVDEASLQRVAEFPGSVITSTAEPILASQSVAFYQAVDGRIRFIFDPAHKVLSVPEPFIRIANSGQVWKFHDVRRLAELLAIQSERDFRGTNLPLVEAYFQALDPGGFGVVGFARWHNCNTLEDYRRAFDRDQQP